MRRRNGFTRRIRKIYLGLGYLTHYARVTSASRFGRELFRQAIANFKNLTHLRGIANTIIGVSYYLKADPCDYETMATLKKLTDKLAKAYHSCKSEKWR